MNTKFYPFNDIVVIEPAAQETKTRLPGTASVTGEATPYLGRIVNFGPKSGLAESDKGSLVTWKVAAEQGLVHGGERVLFVSSKDILAIIDEKGA